MLLTKHIVFQIGGTSFRPKYVQITKVRDIFKTVPIIAMTATADPTTLDDIYRVLKFSKDSCDVFRHSVNRPNISYKVISKVNEGKQLLDILKKYPKDACGIIYTATRAKAEQLEQFLQTYNYDAKAFHAGMPVKTKKEIQDKYLNKELNIIIATIAFGMGIDRDDVRYVINIDIPNSLEEFSQMSGRASRDGAPAQSYLFYSDKDYSKASWLVSKSITNPERLTINLRKLQTMKSFCLSTTVCRRSMLVTYFGDPEIEYCGNCDVCKT